MCEKNRRTVYVFKYIFVMQGEHCTIESRYKNRVGQRLRWILSEFSPGISLVASGIRRALVVLSHLRPDVFWNFS